MKQIQNLYLENLPKGAHYSFNQSVVKRIKNDSTLCGKPQLIPLIAKYEAAFLVEEEKFKISQKSEFTDSLNQLDDMRDSAYRGIKQIVGGYAKVPDADIQKAAKALDQLITDYRINVDVQRDQESGLLSNFIADLDGKCAAHVQTLGMGKAVQVLKEANNQYIEVREVRTEERMHKEKKALETACAATDTAYRALIAMVNALAMVEGEADYADFIDYMNSLVSEYKAEVLNQSAKPATPSQPEDDTAGGEEQPAPGGEEQPGTGGDDTGGEDQGGTTDPGGDGGGDDDDDDEGGLAG